MDGATGYDVQSKQEAEKQDHILNGHQAASPAANLDMNGKLSSGIVEICITKPNGEVVNI